MDPSSIRQIIILLILLLLSAFFSSAETALTTVNKHRIRGLAESGNPRAKRVLLLISNSEKMLSTILIGNNIVNLSASSLTTTLAIHLANHYGFGKNASTFIGIATGVLTILILILGEITPKTIATKENERLSLLYSGPIYVLTKLLTPLIYIVNTISYSLCRLLGLDPNQTVTMTEMELRTIVDVSQEDGVIEKEEKKLINNVVDFGDSVAKDIMIPRIDVTFAAVDTPYAELARLFIEEQYSRIPIYESTKDKVIGVLNLKDLFFYRETHRPEVFELRDILRKPYFTFEFQKTSVLMEEMRKRSITFAIVLDEYGCTAGVVTMEDLIEEIIGEIRDEFDLDEESDMIKRINDHEFEVEGSIKLDDLNEFIGTDIESEDYDSIGGHLIELLDHFPEEGETVREGDYLYSVRKMDKNRIARVYIRTNTESHDNP
ncbi:MAG: hemolysin family protein [Eubacteriales bacterium]|nr:hemolysin family protein [Eubacteriales bacterium]